MRKKTKLYLLLTLLAVAGLAGRQNPPTLSSQARSLAYRPLRQIQAELLKQVNGLSQKQLDFKPSPTRNSIRECMEQLTLSEKALWNYLGTALNNKLESAGSEAERLLNDEDIYVLQGIYESKMPAITHKPPVKNFKETLNAYKLLHKKMMIYLRTTSDDLRHHFASTPMGRLDAYQLLLLASAENERCLLRIRAIKSSNGYPE